MIQRQKSSADSEAQRADERVRRYLDEKTEMQSKYDQLQKTVADKDANFKELQETCAVMDEQIRVSMIYYEDRAIQLAHSALSYLVGV